MSDTGYVYTLNDPRTGVPKYVGATKDPENRLNQHRWGNTNSEVSEWIEELEAGGMSPNMTLVHVTSLGELPESELEVIDRLSEEWELLNRSDSATYSARGEGERAETTQVRIPDTVADRARKVKEEHDFASIGEAIRHMCQEGNYDV